MCASVGSVGGAVGSVWIQDVACVTVGDKAEAETVGETVKLCVMGRADCVQLCVIGCV